MSREKIKNHDMNQWKTTASSIKHWASDVRSASSSLLFFNLYPVSWQQPNVWITTGFLDLCIDLFPILGSFLDDDRMKSDLWPHPRRGSWTTAWGPGLVWSGFLLDRHRLIWSRLYFCLQRFGLVALTLDFHFGFLSLLFLLRSRIVFCFVFFFCPGDVCPTVSSRFLWRSVSFQRF